MFLILHDKIIFRVLMNSLHCNVKKITHNVRQYGWRRLRETTLMTAAAAAGNNRQSYAMTRR